MATTRITGPAQLRDAYRKVTERIAQAAARIKRQPRDIVLVAVTKTATPDQIRMLADLGHADFGENRVQQLQQRVVQLEEYLSRKRQLGSVSTKAPGGDQPASSVRWHMIGHLQRNKVKPVVPLVQLVHSVESLRLAEELHAFGARHDRIVDMLIQVNSSGEATKFGVAPPAVLHLAEQLDSMVNLRVRGLMTMAPYSDNPEDSRDTFARTRELFEEIREAKIGGGEFNILSMGMSNDFEVAIEEGANLVRVGRALFGDEEQM
jgi:pyridoxal phosphate enzyme (YggS family)